MAAIGRPPTGERSRSADLSTCQCGVLLDFDSRGYPIPHRCCSCQDTGFVRFLREKEDPLFGRAERCPDCRGNIRPVAEAAVSMNIPVAFRGKTFAAWEDVGDQRRLVQKWLGEKWPPKKPLLTMAGRPGSGKTHLACAAMQDVYERHQVRSQFWNVGRLLDRYRATFDDTATESIADIDLQLDRVPLLVLDEFGMHKNTEFAEERIFGLLNRRYSDAKATIVTTNLNPSEIGALDVRIYSRLMDDSAAVRIPFNLPDYRQRRAS